MYEEYIRETPIIEKNENERAINYIEKIVITHDDFDHNGGCESLINNFNVGKIIETI